MGPTGRAVAANVKRLRASRGLTLRALAAALKEAGRPLSADALNKIENGAPDAEPTKSVRRVDVDDLMALAVVFEVNPSALLLPLDDSPESSMQITGAGPISADIGWDWADGKRPLKLPDGDASTAMLEHALHSRPPRRRPAVRTPEQLAKKRWQLERLISVGPEGRDQDAVREDMRRIDPEPWDEEGRSGKSLD